MRKRRIQDPVAHFWARVDRSGGADACWPWLGAVDGNGYAYTYWVKDGKGGTTHASRVALEISGVALGVGAYACHHCDNPLCVNPGHLFAGVQRDNIRDCIAKGRHSAPPKTDWRKRTIPHHWQKLTEEQARDIKRRAFLAETHAVIAAEYGISPKTVSKIKLGQRWPHL